MISYLKGSLEAKNIDSIVVEVGGVGYKVFMSRNSMDKIGELGEVVKVHTYMRVREDDISLYGFCSNEELKMFKPLITVSGAGAQSPPTISSTTTPSKFALAIISGDVGALKSLPGIGAKSAQRMILELKDKMKTEEAIQSADVITQYIPENNNARDAVEALQVLGYARKDIDIALSKIDTNSLSVEDIIKQGLKYLGR